MSRSLAVLLLGMVFACSEFPARGESTPQTTNEITPASLYNLADAWTDQDGKPVRPGDFEGDVVVVAMFFSNCAYACPRIIADMKAIESLMPEALAAHVHYVLASFDTQRDLPAVLKRHAESNHLPAERWTLLHGDEDAVQSLAAVLGVKYRKDADGNFGHSMIITVLDRAGEIVHQQAGLGAEPQETVQAILRSAGQNLPVARDPKSGR